MTDSGTFGRQPNTTDRYSSAYPSVAPTVEHMTYQRLAYADQDTTDQMHVDCHACAAEMNLPEETRGRGTFAEQKRGGDIEVSDAAVYLANRLHLHLD